MAPSYVYAGFRHDRAAKKALADADSLLGEGQPEHAKAALSTARRAASVWLLPWLVSVLALLATLGMDNTFSRIAVLSSKMAVVTFGGTYAVLAYVA